MLNKDIYLSDSEMDNLNTHTPASFYKAFRLSQKLEIHYTPKHGSWLDIAEIELSALTIQCLLGERIPSVDTLNQILVSWSLKRNPMQKGFHGNLQVWMHE